MGQLVRLRRQISIFIFVFFVHCLVAQQHARSQIRGSVKDELGNPIEFATLYIEETKQGAQSDSKGNFIFQVPPGSYSLRVQFMGYETEERVVRVEQGKPATVHVVLSE